jgi:hypothetical protein
MSYVRRCWSDYTEGERRSLSNKTKARLLRRHLLDWIEYWCEREGTEKKGFQMQLNQLIRYVRKP